MKAVCVWSKYCHPYPKMSDNKKRKYEVIDVVSSSEDDSVSELGGDDESESSDSDSENEQYQFRVVRARMYEEGIHYCFTTYSDFEDVEDPEFHTLRLAYVKASEDLENYINEKAGVGTKK